MADTHNEYRVQQLDRGRLPDLEWLHHAVYGRWPASNYFGYKYDTSYTGLSFMGYIAYDACNKPAAYYGVLPCYIQASGNKLLAAQSGDTMTHPAHRNKGLFVALANRTYALCRQQGVQLVFGFPNQNSEHGLIRKLGWVTTGNLERFHIPVQCFPKERLARKSGWSRNWYENYCKGVLKNYRLPEAGIGNTAMVEGFGGVLRDEAYLAYKKYSPAFVIGIGASKLWIRLNHELTIGDMDCAANEFIPTMEKLKRLTAKLGLPGIHFQSSTGTRLHGLFAANYTGTPSFPVCFKDFGSGLDLEKIQFSFADIDVF